MGLWKFVRARFFLIALVPLLVWVTLEKPYQNGPAIRSDGRGYDLWTRAILTSNFKFCSFLERGDPDVRAAIAFESKARGVCQIKYPPGVAMLRLPLAFHWTDTQSTIYRVSKDGHLACLVYGALAFLFIAFVIHQKLLLLRVPPSVAEAASLFVLFGGGVFHYATYDASLSHIYSALTLTALLAVYVPLPRRELAWSKVAVAFLASSLLVLTRNLNLIVIALGILYIWRAKKWRPLKTLRLVWPVMIGATVGEAMQLAYTYWSGGKLSIVSYGNERFLWDRPMWRDVLWSYEKGLFVHFPIVAVVLGASILARKTRVATLYFAACIGAYAVVYGYWWCWYLGGFGHRGFVELMPIAALLFGSALSALGPWLRRLSLVAGAIATACTVQLMFRYWAGNLTWHLVPPAVFRTQLMTWDRLTWLAAGTCAFLALRAFRTKRVHGGARRALASA